MPDNTLLLVAIGIAAFVVLRLVITRPKLSAEEAARLARSGQAIIVDVREPAEWRGGVAKPAELLPLSDLRGGRARWDPFLRKNQDKRLLVYCHSGMRSAQAAALLRREGVDAVNLGGLGRWVRAGLPIRKP